MAEQSLVPTEAKPPALTAGGNVAAIIPKNIEEVFRLAGAMVKSGMAPASLKTPEQAMVAILAGAELGLPPFQALQSFAVINGRPAIWGDGLIAVVRSNGFKVKEWLEGEGDDLTAWCMVTRPDNGEEITRSFSIADARKANLWGKTGPWQSNPKRMLQMRARGFACRDGAADVLRGFQMREEVEDYDTRAPVQQAARTDVRERLEARVQQEREGFSSSFNPSAGDAEPQDAEFAERAETAAEEIDASLHQPEEQAAIIDDFPGDQQRGFASALGDDIDPEAWARDLINDDGILLKTAADIDALFGDKEATRRFKRLQSDNPSIAKELTAALNGKRKALASKEQG